MRVCCLFRLPCLSVDLCKRSTEPVLTSESCLNYIYLSCCAFCCFVFFFNINIATDRPADRNNKRTPGNLRCAARVGPPLVPGGGLHPGLLTVLDRRNRRRRRGRQSRTGLGGTACDPSSRCCGDGCLTTRERRAEGCGTTDAEKAGITPSVGLVWLGCGDLIKNRRRRGRGTKQWRPRC